MTSLSFLSTPSILSIPSLLCLTWWSPGLLCVDCPFVLSVSDVSRSFLHHRRDRQNGFRFGKNRFRHLLKPGFSCGQNWTKPGFRWWPKTGSMIEENRFNGEFKISPWRNFVNINKLFSYVAPNYSEELENTVCHQRWRKHTNRRRLTRRPRPSFLLYCWERKIEQPNISFIFCGWVWGVCGEESAGTAGALPQYLCFPHSFNFLVYPWYVFPSLGQNRRRAYPPAHSNT